MSLLRTMLVVGVPGISVCIALLAIVSAQRTFRGERALKDFYHYASEDAIDTILQTDFVPQSRNGGPGARFGTGVYGTSLAPTTSRRIAWEDWRQGWTDRDRTREADYVLHLWIPAEELVEFQGQGRQVYLYRGLINLNNYEWEVLEV